MNILTQNNQQSMTSQQIAELVETRHSLVKQSIERLVAKGSISQPPLVNGIKAANGVTPTHYVFTGEQGKRDSYVVVAQLSPEFTAALVDRWQELEQQVSASNPVAPALPDFTNPAEAARAWASEFEQKQIAQEQLALAAPKVAHYDAVVERSTLLNATQVAHSIGLPSAQALNKKLEPMGVYNGNCKRGKEFRAWFIEKGLGEMKQASTGHQQPLFTTKGQAWIFEKLASSEVA